jgi:hypothetical protein
LALASPGLRTLWNRFQTPTIFLGASVINHAAHATMTGARIN